MSRAEMDERQQAPPQPKRIVWAVWVVVGVLILLGVVLLVVVWRKLYDANLRRKRRQKLAQLQERREALVGAGEDASLIEDRIDAIQDALKTL